MISPNRRHDRSSFYKYTTAEAAKAILGGQVLRWSSPILFNDPFDIPREADLGFSAEKLVEACTALFLRMLSDGRQPSILGFAELKREVERQGVPPHVVAKAMRMHPLVERTTIENELERFKSTWADIVPRLRVLCMSERPDGPTMWTHYADDHRGVALEFQASDELDSSWLLAKPVVYRAEAPSLPGADYWARVLLEAHLFDWIKFFGEYLYTKTLQWAPEMEWRTVSLAPETESGLYRDQSFHADELVSVRLGGRIPEDDTQAIVDLVRLRYPKVTIWNAVADHVARGISFRPFQHAAT